MPNLKPYKFTQADRIKGGKQASLKRLNTNNINKVMQAYLDGEGIFDTQSFTEDILSLNPKDRLNFLMAWMPYERPKLQTIEQVIDISGNLEISREERVDRIKEILMKVS